MTFESTVAADYIQARAHFRAAARAGRYELTSHAIGAAAPDGSELTIDIALRGPETASRTLVVSSGLHGIEGHFGSAVQRAFLSAGHAPSDVRIVLVHALNPYGFAWGRRVDADNVDLNRNFLLEGEAYEGAHPSYRELDPLLNPRSGPTRLDPFLVQALGMVLARGFGPLKNAVAQGQYEYPEGLFYGGSAPTITQRILRAQLRAWLGRPERVLHLDLHTGRGRSGDYKLCVDLPSEPASPRLARLRASFGKNTIEGFDPGGVLYEVRGGLGRFLVQHYPELQYDCLLAEFGTYHALRVLAALRREIACITTRATMHDSAQSHALSCWKRSGHVRRAGASAP